MPPPMALRRIFVARRFVCLTNWWAFCCLTSAAVVHHKVSGSNISRTFSIKITKFYKNIHADLVYSNTGYDVTSNSRSALIEVRKNV